MMKIQLQKQHRKYEKYKNTGVPWVSEVPEDWKIKKVKFCTKVFNGATPRSSIDTYWDGGINWYTPADIDKNKKYLDDPKRTISREGYNSCGTHLVKEYSIIVSNRAPIGLIAMGKKPFCANQGCKSLEVKKEHSPDFLYYFLSANSDVLDSFGNGSTFKELSTSALANFQISLPEKKEQITIANYLDEKTALLDQIIASKKKQIELLKEKRNSLINRAVTRGLDENVEMKDSGVEWIGEVPKGWEIRRLKTLGKAIIGLTYAPEDVVDEEDGILVLRSSNIQNQKLSFENNVFVNKIIPKKLITKAGDILICSRNGSRHLIGKNVCIDEKNSGVTFGAFMTIFRSKFWKFLSWSFNSSLFEAQSSSYLTSTINQLTTGNLNNMIVTIPGSIKEQEEISYFLDSETKKIDQTINLIERSITFLDEYKISLISNVVTGKVKIS